MIVKTRGKMSIKVHKGFTLIEVLVSMIVLAIGLLGLAGLQLTSLKAADSAYHRSQASVLADDILDRMRSNRDVALAGSYNISLGADPSGTSSISDVDLVNWKAMLSGTIPSGDGSVGVAANIATITVQWDDSRASGSSAQTFTVVTQL